MSTSQLSYVSITPLLKQLATIESAKKANPQEIAAAVELIFENKISPVQFALLLWALHTTGLDHKPDILAATAGYMRAACPQVDRKALQDVVNAKAKAEGNYRGGLVRYARMHCTNLHHHGLILTCSLPGRHSRHRRRRPQHFQHLHHLLHPRQRHSSRRKTRQ
jgi:hypothetical protein